MTHPQTCTVQRWWLWLLLLLCSLPVSSIFAAPSVGGSGLRIQRLREPPLLGFAPTELACYRYLQKKYKRPRRRWPREPKTVAEARVYLEKARKEKRLYLRRGAILARLQQVIHQHRRGNLYLLFGNNHTIRKHYRFFNEILTPGQDGIRLQGLTHLGLEAFTADIRPARLSPRTQKMLRNLWTSPKSRRLLLTNAKVRSRLFKMLLSGQQHLLDLYIRKGQRWAYRLLYVSNLYLMGRSYPRSFLQEVQRTLSLARRYPGGLNVVGNDMSMRLRRRYFKLRCWLYPLREYFSWRIMQRRIRKRKRNVIAYMWGADHIHRNNIPRFIPRWSRYYSVRLQGGKKETIWDQAARQLGLPRQLIAIETPRSGSSHLRILFPPRISWQMLALKRWRQLRQLRQARLLRGRRSPRWAVPDKATRAYIEVVRTTVQLMRGSLRRCQASRSRPLPLRMLVAPEGRVIRLTLPRSTRSRGWSAPCVRRHLTKIPLAVTPHQRPVSLSLTLRPVLFSRRRR